MKIIDREFVCYFHFVSWRCLSLGFHIDLQNPNIEMHVPFGFIRIGWKGFDVYHEDEIEGRTFGYNTQE